VNSRDECISDEFAASTPMFEKRTIWEELRVPKQIHFRGIISKKMDF